MSHLSAYFLRRFLQDRRGVAAIEFAMLAPVFLLILFGMTAYGVYFGASHSVQQIAADAARTAVAGLSQAERQAMVASFVNRNAGTYPFIEAGKVSVETRHSAADGSRFTVQVSYDAASLPVWSLFPGLSLPGQTISRTSTVRIGGL